MDKLATATAPLPGNGTETHTASGQLRWNFINAYRATEDQALETFRRHVMDTEPHTDFAQFAQLTRALPESHHDARLRDWETVLSAPATALLATLDALHTADLTLAIKVAAMSLVSVGSSFEIHRQLVARLEAWLSDSASPLATRVDLGLLLLEHWPHREPYTPRSLLLVLVVQESARDPVRLRGAIEPLRSKSHNASGTLLSNSDDKQLLLALGRNMRALDPWLAAVMFSGFLCEVRTMPDPEPGNDRLAREVAADLFALLSAIPAAHTDKPQQLARAWCTLLRTAHRDVPWYPAATVAALVATRRMDDWHEALGNLFTIAVNAVDQPAAAQALVHYTDAIALRQAAPDADWRSHASLCSTLLEELDGLLALRYRSSGSGRNVDLPPCPEHALHAIIVDKFWAQLEHVVAIRPDAAAHVLANAMNSKDTPLAGRAAERLVQIFPQAVASDPTSADSLLGWLAKMTFASDFSEERRRDAQQLYDRLLPVLLSIAPHAARTGRHFHNPLTDR